MSPFEKTQDENAYIQIYTGATPPPQKKKKKKEEKKRWFKIEDKKNLIMNLSTKI